MSKLNIAIPRPLEACFALVRPRTPSGKVHKFIVGSFYAPPRSRYNGRLAEFLAVTLGQLRAEHPGCRVILGADINDMKLDALRLLDPSLRQMVTFHTNKLATKTLDVILTDCPDLLQEPTRLPPLQVDPGKDGKDSDHYGVEVLPRTNLAPRGGSRRERISVRPFPESGLARHGVALLEEEWPGMAEAGTSTKKVVAFEERIQELLDRDFPSKMVSVGPDDLPYFTEELRSLKRRRQRAYTAQGPRGPRYLRLKEEFVRGLEAASLKYQKRIEDEVKEGKRGSGYAAIRKLGNRPGEGGGSQGFSLPAHVVAQLSPRQSAERLADHFSSISQAVDPLDESLLCPVLRQALEDGRATQDRPVLDRHQVYRRMGKLSKPKSAVPGDVPRQLIKEFTFEYAGPATSIINEIFQSSSWPHQWKTEHVIVLSKTKEPPKDEDGLRNISKTAWLSKLAESLLGDFLLPAVEPFLDPGQCGGLKGSSIEHYLLRIMDFIHRTLDSATPHAALLGTEDLSKAYNRGSHPLVLEDLHAMHVPGWVLAVVASYLSGRSMVLTHQGATAARRDLPGGFGQGVWLGGLLFIVQFHGACLRPALPRPISGNKVVKVKYVDDSTQVASINLAASLMRDPVERQRPLTRQERFGTVLRAEENVLQHELDAFTAFAEDNKFVINKKKCFVMKFCRARTYDFPPELTVGGSPILEQKDTLKILGVQVQSDLGWGAQCNQMVRRATNTIWILRRMKSLGVAEPTLVQYWKSEGRVHLEMAVPVWHSSLTLAQSRALCRAQRVAMAAITGRWEPSHTAQLQQLGLEPLPERRARLCRRFAMRTATRSRHQDLFQPTGSTRPERGCRPRPLYREPHARTAAYNRSALPYLTRLLNGVQT
jgi:hypothetical protein